MKIIDLDRHRYCSPAQGMEFYCEVVYSGKYCFLSIASGGLSGEPFTLLEIELDTNHDRFEFDGCIGYAVDRRCDAYPFFECYDDVIKMIDYLNDRFNHLNDTNLESIVLEFD